jgi:hypothetical protein
MTHEELMSLLADRPGCCAGLRVAATDEIVALKARIVELEAAIRSNHEIIWSKTRENEVLSRLCRALRDVNASLDGDKYSSIDETAPVAAMARRLTLRAAENPRGADAELMLEAAALIEFTLPKTSK